MRLAAALGAAEGIHEQRRLKAFDGRLAPEDRYAHEQAGIEQHAPEHGVSNRVEAFQSEKLIGPQQLDAIKALLEEFQR